MRQPIAERDYPAKLRNLIRERRGEVRGLPQGFADDFRLPFNGRLQHSVFQVLVSVRPSVNLKTRAQASWTSKSSFLTSRDLIYWHLGLVHRFLEVRVSDLVDLDQVNGPSGTCFRAFP